MCNISEKEEKMPASTKSQKGTAMDYLSAPRDSGIVKNLMSELGYSAPEGGRLPAGVKVDTLVALTECFNSEIADEFKSMLCTRIGELQASRRTVKPRLTATPESVINAVKLGQISLEELKSAIDKLG